MDDWMSSLAGTDGRQKAESRIRNEELGNGRMEIGIRKEETAKWKRDRENRKEERGIRKWEDGNSKWERGIRNLELGNREKTMNEQLGLRFRKTWDIIEAAERGLLPGKVMLNVHPPLLWRVHPQRWTDRPLPWVKELVGQNVKNVIKKWIIRMSSLAGKDE